MSSVHDSSDSPAPILRPGRNCWRLAEARRFAMLVDAERYFRVLRQALCQARHSIFILSWDIDSRVCLVPGGAHDGYPEPLGEFLHALVESRPGLQIRILNWNFAMMYALEREWQAARLGWKRHKRLQFVLDAEHPLGASHHQKLVVIDDDLAFAGGLDITRCRWDTPHHAVDEPGRCDSAGQHYAPFHDVQAMVQGEAARALGDLARERWRRATGQLLPATEGITIAWPDEVRPDLCDIPVGIARTEPAFEGRSGTYEIRQLHLDAIASAREVVFFENQYFTSDLICNALAARLHHADALEVLIVSPRQQSGWLEQATMGVLRARVHRRLRAADTHERYRLYCARLQAEEDGPCLNLHSKVMAADDRLFCIGSANLSNRSMALDTECLLAVEAGGERYDEISAIIAGLRNRLLAEHLETVPESVTAAVQTHRGWHAALQSLQGPERTLVVFEPPLSAELEALIPDHAIIDPERPIAADRLVEEFVPPEVHRPMPRRLLALGTLAVGLAAAAALWRLTPLGAWLNPVTVLGVMREMQALPLAPVAVLAGYVVAGLAMVPVTLLIGVTGMVFGPVLGAVYAILGTLMSASATYGVGRWLGKPAVQRMLGPRTRRMSRRFSEQGLLAMVVTRILPVAPFSMVNVIAGALQIRFRDYAIGTVVGMTPGIVITVTFAHHLAEAVRHPTPGGLAVMVAVAALLILLALGLQRLFARRKAGAA